MQHPGFLASAFFPACSSFNAGLLAKSSRKPAGSNCSPVIHVGSRIILPSKFIFCLISNSLLSLFPFNSKMQLESFHLKCGGVGKSPSTPSPKSPKELSQRFPGPDWVSKLTWLRRGASRRMQKVLLHLLLSVLWGNMSPWTLFKALTLQKQAEKLRRQVP